MALLYSLYNTFKSKSLSAFINWLIFSTPPLEPVPKTSLQCLPNEILLEIFSFLELKPYILCYGVCKEWRKFLPLTNLHPIRERLLNLYHRILDTPDFYKALEWTNQNLEPFDREEYIRCLLTQYPVIPEEFRMWILEWPARLVVQSTWPGLPFTYSREDSLTRRSGVNWIAYRPSSPKLSALVYKLDTPLQTFIPGLLIWRNASITDWLVVTEDEPSLSGRVFCLHLYYHSPGSIPYYPCRENSALETEQGANSESDNEGVGSDVDEDSHINSGRQEGEEYLVTFDDWIDYLNTLWSGTAKEIGRHRQTISYPDFRIPQPVQYIFNGPTQYTLPAHMWDSSQRTLDRQNYLSVESSFWANGEFD